MPLIYAEQSAHQYAIAQEWESKDPRDKLANAKNLAATWARLCGSKLREISQALAEEERAEKATGASR